MAELTTVYAVTKEDSEGRIIGYHAFYSTEAMAITNTKGHGAWGSDSEVKALPAIILNGNTYILQFAEPDDVDLNKAKADEQLRQETLSSLSSEQRRVLGLK